MSRMLLAGLMARRQRQSPHPLRLFLTGAVVIAVLVLGVWVMI
jgi:hypothetical protein